MNTTINRICLCLECQSAPLFIEKNNDRRTITQLWLKKIAKCKDASKDLPGNSCWFCESNLQSFPDFWRFAGDQLAHLSMIKQHESLGTNSIKLHNTTKKELPSYYRVLLGLRVQGRGRRRPNRTRHNRIEKKKSS